MINCNINKYAFSTYSFIFLFTSVNNRSSIDSNPISIFIYYLSISEPQIHGNYKNNS